MIVISFIVMIFSRWWFNLNVGNIEFTTLLYVLFVALYGFFGCL